MEFVDGVVGSPWLGLAAALSTVVVGWVQLSDRRTVGLWLMTAGVLYALSSGLEPLGSTVAAAVGGQDHHGRQQLIELAATSLHLGLASAAVFALLVGTVSSRPNGDGRPDPDQLVTQAARVAWSAYLGTPRR